jgi:flagellar hook-associated protein 1 FlgK
MNGAAGGPLLGPSTGTGAVTAANLTVLVSDPRKIAASSVAPAGGVAAVDHGNADAMSQLETAAGGVDATYRQLVVQLGVRAASAGRDLQIQTTVTAQVDTDRQGVSGVDLDEEMSNMLSFQHAYSAAARLVTAIDETLDVLINRTGRVGL